MGKKKRHGVKLTRRTHKVVAGSEACPAIVCGVCLFSVSYDLLASWNELSSTYDGVQWMQKHFSVLMQRQNCILEGFTAQMGDNAQLTADCTCTFVFACMCM